MADPVQTPDAPPERASFGDLATQIAGTREQLLDARRNEERVLERQAATQAPKIAGAQAQLGAVAAAGNERLAAVEAAKPEIAPPPSRKLTEFLSPVQGESPEASVLKMIQGLGLLAGSIGGLARGDARGALAGLKGALAGWSEGDAARADRAFKDWQAKTDAALAKWQVEAESYDRWFNNQNLSVEMMLKGFELDAIAHGNEKAVAAARSGRFEEALRFLTDTRNHEDQVALRLATLQGMHAEKERDREFRAQMAQDAREARERMQKEQDEAVLSAYTPEALTALGQQWALGQPVQVGMGRSGQLVRGKVVEAGIRWAKDNNVDLAALPGIRAEVATARTTLTAVSKQRAFTLANADNFERHLDSLVRLSETVDRNKRPVIARYQLQLKREYQGDPETATYATQAYEVAQEFAKLMVGSAQGDAESRAEARRMIDAALNPEQLRAVSKQLKQNAEQRVQVWDTRMKEQSSIINNAAKLKASPAPDDPLGIRR